MRSISILIGMAGAALLLAATCAIGAPDSQAAPEAASKTKVCVMAFQSEGDIEPHLGNFLYNALIDRLVNSDELVVVDWAQIDETFRFFQQSQPAMVFEDARKQAVQELGIDKLYYGSLSKVGRKYYLLVKVLNFDLTVERTERQVVFSEDALEAAIAVLAERLSLPRAKMAWTGGMYDGGVRDGKPQGQGTLSYDGKDGIDRYEGQWKEGKRHGEGTLFYAPGNARKMVRCEGQWRNDQANGPGAITWECGSKYIGQLRQGLPEGTGTLYHVDGRMEVGAWKQGHLNGQAAVYSSAIDKAVGLCEMGQRQGTWTLYHGETVQGKTVYMGEQLAVGEITGK